MTSGFFRFCPLVMAFNLRGEEQVSGREGGDLEPGHHGPPVAWVLVGVHPACSDRLHEPLSLRWLPLRFCHDWLPFILAEESIRSQRHESATNYDTAQQTLWLPVERA